MLNVSLEGPALDFCPEPFSSVNLLWTFRIHENVKWVFYHEEYRRQHTDKKIVLII